MKTLFSLALACAVLLSPALSQTAAENERCAKICGQVGMTCILGSLSDPGPGADKRYVDECRRCARTWCGGTPPQEEKPRPEAPQLDCLKVTDQTSVRISWSAGKEIKDYTITVGTSAGGNDLGTIGPLRNQTSTGIGGIPVGKTIFVKLQAYSNDGDAMTPSFCSIQSLDAAGLAMRIMPAMVISGDGQRYGPGENEAQCSAVCKADPQCNAFTFRRGDSLPPGSQRCVLMSGAKAATPNSCCVSGVKERTSAQPPPGPPPGPPPPPPRRGGPLEGAWTRNGSDSVRIEVNGNAVVFLDQTGRRVDGRIVDDRVVVDTWGSSAVVSGNELRWSNGPVWTRIGGGGSPGPGSRPAFMPSGNWQALADGSLFQFAPIDELSCRLTLQINGSQGTAILRWNGRNLEGPFSYSQGGQGQEIIIGTEQTVTQGRFLAYWRAADGSRGSWALQRR